MNRRMKLAAALALTCMTLTSTAAFARDKPVELSPAELAAAQSRTYAVPSAVAFVAAISVLQTLGYVDIVASKDAGTISGVIENKGKIYYNVFWGIGKKKLTQKAAILVESSGANESRVRLNIILAVTKRHGYWDASDGDVARTVEPYHTLFTALDPEIAARSSAGRGLTMEPASPLAVPSAPASN